MNAEEAEVARTVGWRLWQLRDDRGKSVRAVAELAGMSTTTLWRTEQGKRALASHAEAVALAKALQIAPDELTRLALPAPGNGHTDSASDDVRLALMAVSRHRPGGEVLPVKTLRARVYAAQDALHQCRKAELSAMLPGLIRDVHTTLAAGRDVAELLDSAVLLHVQAVSHWLREVGAPLDLRRDNDLTLTYQLAERRDTPVALGLAAYGATRVTLAAGAFDLAQADLEAVTVPTNSPESMQLAGMLALSQSLVAANDSRPADAQAAVEQAAELAARTGEGTAYGLGFGPTNVGCWRMEAMLEIGDHELVTALAEGLNPDVHPYRSRQSAYWRDYGRGLARLRDRRDDAVMALRRAETIHPHRVLRDPMVHEVLGELLHRTSRDSPAGRELRGMARRAKLLTE
ncbi:MAG: helix-turn-helix domain-containing protein [Pseudonocardiaceae bacterium]